MAPARLTVLPATVKAEVTLTCADAATSSSPPLERARFFAARVDDALAWSLLPAPGDGYCAAARNAGPIQRQNSIASYAQIGQRDRRGNGDRVGVAGAAKRSTVACLREGVSNPVGSRFPRTARRSARSSSAFPINSRHECFPRSYLVRGRNDPPGQRRNQMFSCFAALSQLCNMNYHVSNAKG